MSEKIILVKYVLEDGVPIDESSANLQSAYIPEELTDWIKEKDFIAEIKIKESNGEIPDIPVSIIKNESSDCIESILQYVENTLVRFIEDARLKTADGIIIRKDLDKDFSNLLTWLKIREILIEKESHYPDDISIKLVVG